MTLVTPEQHQQSAQAAREAAFALYDIGSSWHVVPAHYSALHLIQCDLASRTDLPLAMRATTQHRSTWSNAERTAWGVNDVVRAVYDDELSKPFHSVAQASHAVRYSAPFKIGDRPWQDYLKLLKALAAS